MCHHSSCPCVTVEEAVAAEESLLVYCKPVEFYNILQRRARQNPSFLPRCLNHKIKAKRKTGLMNGNVIFNYKDQKNLSRKTEVTKQFSCPFCLMRCGSFKGLKDHLMASHDLFRYEFYGTQEYTAVGVSVKTDALNLEATVGEISPQLQSFYLCKKPLKRKRPENPLDKGKYVYPHELEPKVATETLQRGPPETNGGEKDSTSCCNDREMHSRLLGENHNHCENGTANCMDYGAAKSNPGVTVARAESLEDVDCVQSMSVDKNITPTLLPHAKSRKLSIERTDPRSSTLLLKRQFYHSHRAQPMALEQVLSDKDSEDEVDDMIADIEDKRNLEDFVDVSKDEKHLMLLWNSFMRKQRVLADGHIPWACEAFTRVHGKELVQSSPLCWCWRFFMIKLWNHGLLEAKYMDKCSKILQELQDEEGSANGKSVDTINLDP